MSKFVYKDLVASTTEKLIAMLEAGGLPAWTKSWNDNGYGANRNAKTKRPYLGLNQVLLYLRSEDEGWPCFWATYKQWQSMGCQVQRGEKSTLLVKWSPVEKVDPATGKVVKGMIPFAFNVHNVAQTDADVDRFKVTVRENPDERIPEVDSWVDAVGAQIRFGGNRAYYQPSTDLIQVPQFEDFDGAETFYGTLFHELVHWTGPRLKRDLSGRFGDETYAFEELIAELGAASLSGLHGLSASPREDHASYLASWLKGLRADPKFLMSCLSLVSKSVSFLDSKDYDVEDIENGS